MWIVQLALRRPYTFIVAALLLVIVSPLVILRTPTDIFPNINIPVVSIVWQYTGLAPTQFAGRITSVFERTLTTTVNDIEHIESQTFNGVAVVKVFFHPGAKIETALAQITAVGQTSTRLMPQGTNPPLIITYNASSVPILQLGLSGEGLSEQQLNDYATNDIRTQLATVAGASVPWPYGGKVRQVTVDIDPDKLNALGLSPNDVLAAVSAQNIVLPTGTIKIGPTEYNVDLNGSPTVIDELNDLPIKTVNSTLITMRNVAHVRDGFQVQTNIVRQNGRRGSLLSVYKTGNASTLDIVKQVRDALPSIAATLPAALRIEPMFDQSVFVRAAVQGVVREALVAACLTALLILLFLGNWRHTVVIAISIPLAILSSICILSVLGQTLNIMTLGGLALAVGILVDDATVTIENIDRHLELGEELHDGILKGASQIATPAFVSTLCICIVFVPMFLLAGVARFLFVPLAMAVVFAMLSSYVISRTLVPTLVMYFLRRGRHAGEFSHHSRFGRFQASFNAGFEKLRTWYSRSLESVLHARWNFVGIFLGLCLASLLLLPTIGTEFFPSVDTGHIRLHLRTPTGTRIEDTAQITDLVEQSIRRTIPPRELTSILDNIGLPYSGINTAYSNNGTMGSSDAEILVSLAPGHEPSSGYMAKLRETLPREFPGTEFYFQPADIVSQILNFGLSAPIDVQITGSDTEGNLALATEIEARIRRIPGAVDTHIYQLFDQPKFFLSVNRAKANEIGLTERDVASNVLLALSSSTQTSPTYWLNPANGVNYSLAIQAPQYRYTSLRNLFELPVHGATSADQTLVNLIALKRSVEPAVVTHYNVRPVIDIYSSVQGRDLGGVAREVQKIVNDARSRLPRGSQIALRGQVDTMLSSFAGLAAGLVFSVVLVYLLLVVNFQSWLDPLIIITALPGGLAGISWMLFLTGTALSVPALMGALMCMGVAVANSVLVVSFARERLSENQNALNAALDAGTTRLRPVLMTASAMIIGMLPMSLGLGEGGEQNAPLGRAVIGGLLLATVATLFFVPAIFSLIHGRATRRAATTPAPAFVPA